MAGELAYDPATGKLVYSPATGELAKGCVVYGVNCGHCTTGKTPKYWTVTLSGITTAICSACNPQIGPNNFIHFIVTTLTLNAKYLLTQVVGSPCIWKITGVGSWVLDIYSDDICTTFVETRSGTFDITLTRTSGDWRLVIRGYDSGGRDIATAFDDSVSETGAPSTDCVTISTMVNALSCEENTSSATPPWEFFVANGGSASFELGDTT